MTSIKQLKKKIVKEVDSFLSDGLSTVTEIENTMNDIFPYGAKLSEATNEFDKIMKSSGYEDENAIVEKALVTTRDHLLSAIDTVTLLQRYIAIHIPAMEDGNNFGVSVQMVVNKYVKEIKEEWVKALDSIPSYYSARAEAVEKLKLASVSKSKTTTKTDSSSSGGKDGDESKNSTTVTEEEKAIEASKPSVHRIKHLVAIDVQWYSTLRKTLISVVDGMTMILDNMEKNAEKLKSPKGTQGGGISMGMY